MVDWAALEASWRRSLWRRPLSKHDPVYPVEHILQAAHDGNARALDMVEFNRVYPDRRHWHHAVHTEFGLPCDSFCLPARVRGDNLLGRIINAWTIEEIAERYTELRGLDDLKGKCFLHGEENGESFSVYTGADGKRRWHCFGRCGAGGDVVDLVREMKERGMDWNGRSPSGDGGRQGDSVQRSDQARQH